MEGAGEGRGGEGNAVRLAAPDRSRELGLCHRVRTRVLHRSSWSSRRQCSLSIHLESHTSTSESPTLLPRPSRCPPARTIEACPRVWFYSPPILLAPFQVAGEWSKRCPSRRRDRDAPGRWQYACSIQGNLRLARKGKRKFKPNGYEHLFPTPRIGDASALLGRSRPHRSFPTKRRCPMETLQRPCHFYWSLC